MQVLVTAVFEKPVGSGNWSKQPEVEILRADSEEQLKNDVYLVLTRWAKEHRIVSHTVTLLPW